jgi:hypothetical protein
MTSKYLKQQLDLLVEDAKSRYLADLAELSLYRKKVAELELSCEETFEWINQFDEVPELPDSPVAEPAAEPATCPDAEVVAAPASVYKIMPTDFDAYEAVGITTCKTESSRIVLRNCLKWVKSVIQEPTTWDETVLEIYDAYESGIGNVPVHSAMTRFLMNLIKYLRSVKCQVDYDLMKTKMDQCKTGDKETQITRMNKVNYTFDDIRNAIAIEPVDKLLLKLFGDSPNDGNRFPILRPDELVKCVVVGYEETPPTDMNYIQDGVFYNNFSKGITPYSFKIDDDLLQYFPATGLVFGTTNRDFPCRRLKKLTGNKTITCRDLRQLQCYEHRNAPYAFQQRLAELLGHKWSIHKSCYDHLQYEPVGGLPRPHGGLDGVQLP